MGITLANFQLKAIEALMEAMGEPNRDIILKSCTGSGKTIILTHFMDEYLKSTNKAVFVWLTPGKGNLELQSKAKMDKYKDDIKDGFMRFAGRTDIADEVDICLKRPKGYKCFPENLIKEYFKDSQDKAKGKIKRIKIIGTNDAGSFEVDTNITGMKHFLKVKGESVTNEVESSDFFVKAQEFIASMGGRI